MFFRAGVDLYLNFNVFATCFRKTIVTLITSFLSQPCGCSYNCDSSFLWFFGDISTVLFAWQESKLFGKRHRVFGKVLGFGIFDVVKKNIQGTSVQATFVWLFLQFNIELCIFSPTRCDAYTVYVLDTGVSFISGLLKKKKKRKENEITT